MSTFAYGPQVRPRRARRRALTVAAALAMFLVASVAFGQWPVTVSPQAGSKGYGKAQGLPTAFLDTIDVSAEVTGSGLVGPDDANAGCPASCGDLLIKWSSTSPFVIHVSSVTFAAAGLPATCQVGGGSVWDGGRFERTCELNFL